MKPLSGVKILDFTHAHGGTLATMHLTDFGAEVIKVEPPKGDMSRKWAPIKDGAGGYFSYLNRGKRSICVDLNTEDGKSFILDMVKDVDIVCENFSYGVMDKLGLSYENLKIINPNIIYASLSGTGRKGPQKETKQLDEQSSAMSGMLERTGYPDSVPVKLGAQLGCQAGAVYFAMSILLALIHRKRTGEGQMIDVSIVDALVSIIEGTCVTYAITGSIYPRGGNSQFSISPYDTFNAMGGDVAVGVCTDAQWQKFLDGLGMYDLAKDERYHTNEKRGIAYGNGLRKQLSDWIQNISAADIKKAMDEKGIASGIVYSVYDAMESKQIEAREMLVKVSDKNVGDVVMPGIVVKFESCKDKILGSSPILGQDTEYYKEKVKESRSTTKKTRKRDSHNGFAGVLDGMTVVDFTQAYSGPFSTMQLADFGAKVIKVERRESGDQSREWAPFKDGYSGYYGSINRNKLGITLDLKSPEGLEIAKKLIGKAQVLTENFKTGIMEKFGLGYDEVKKINPSIIYASLTGFGQNGPLKDYPAYDNVIQAISGIQDMTGFPDEQAVKCGSSIGDNFTGITFSMAVLFAYWKYLNTGEGERIDLAMFDTLFAMLEYHILCKTMLGCEHERSGNSERGLMVPYDLYECKDGYFSIGVCNEKQWKSFCDATGMKNLYDDERFVDNEARCNNYEVITPIISAWMKVKSKDELTRIFTASEVPNAPLYDVVDIMDSDHSKERELTYEINDPGLGVYRAITNPIKLEKSPATYKKGAPLLGEDNELILKDLGYTDAQIADYKNKDII